MSKAHLFVDQIEDDLAVLVGDGEDRQEYVLPLAELPAVTKEGTWLTVEVPTAYTVASFFAAIENGDEQMPDFVQDKATEEVVKKQVQNLMDELSD